MLSQTAELEPETLSPRDPAIRLSIIIVNWNTRDLLQACLHSLKDYVANPQAEIIVVDNHSTDDSPAMVSSEFPKVRLFAMSDNLGFSRGNNAGIRKAVGQYILLLNSDTEVHGDGLWLMCDHLDQNPKTGAVGAKLLNPDGSIQPSCRSFPSYQTVFFHRKSLLTRLFPRNKFSQKYLMTSMNRDVPHRVDWIMGACLMTRRETLEDIGLLDEDFFMYAEDVDLCYRMHKAGWLIEYFPDARVMHHYEKSASKVPFRMNRERHRSMWRFYKKHYSNGGVLTDTVTALGICGRFTLVTLQSLLNFSKRN